MNENQDIKLPKDGAKATGTSDLPVDRPVHTGRSSAGKRDFLDGFLSVSPEKNEAPEQAATPTAPISAASEDTDNDELHARVIEALCSIFDPEIPVNIYELGLIYSVAITEDKIARIIMTLTTPHCPVAETMPGEVQNRVEMVEGIQGAKVELVWDPPWDPSRMSEAAQLELGFI